MTDFETIARLKLADIRPDRRLPERNRFFEGVLFALGLVAALAGAYFFAVFLLSFA